MPDPASDYIQNDAGHKHAVTAVSGGRSYASDAKVSRTSGGQMLDFVKKVVSTERLLS
jgi:hypothetical protein